MDPVVSAGPATSEEWTEKRHGLVERRDWKNPMTRAEMWGAVDRDKRSSPVDGHYDRRNLLNLVATLLDEAEAEAALRAAPEPPRATPAETGRAK